MKYLILLSLILFGSSVGQAQAIQTYGANYTASVFDVNLYHTVLRPKTNTLSWAKSRSQLNSPDAIKKEVNRWVKKAIPTTRRAPGTRYAKRVINPDPTIPQEGKEEAQNFARGYVQQSPLATENKSQFKGFVNDAVKGLNKKPALVTTQKGRAASPGLKKGYAGVPVYKVQRRGPRSVVKIPRLDIGTEPRISAESLTIRDFRLGTDKQPNAKRLPSKNYVNAQTKKRWLQRKIAVAPKVRDLNRKEFGIGEVVTERKIARVLPEMGTEEPLQLQKYTGLSKLELNLLAIHFLNVDGDKCHLVTGLLTDISGAPAVVNEAKFKLGQCAMKMGLYNEAMKHLFPLVKNETEYASEAIVALASKLPKNYEKQFFNAVSTLKNEKTKSGFTARANYLAAKGAFRSKNYGRALRLAKRVSGEAPEYYSAMYLQAVSHFALGKKRTGVKTLAKLKDLLVKNKVDDKNLNSLVVVNLARMQFRSGQYKAAYKNYKSVDKSHPMWIEALIEQGWTQIALGDFSGAIGNMYSLHSPYFKQVFMPDSYAVRSIGYLNICQYGDAYNSLTQLERRYGRWYNQTAGFLRKNKSSAKSYQTVFNYLKGKSTAKVNGLPPQVIREVARQREFLNIQEAINQRYDEITQLSAVNRLISKDRRSVSRRLAKAKARVKGLKANIARTKTNSTLVKNLTDWNKKLNFEENLVAELSFRSQLYKRSHRNFGKFRRTASRKLNRQIANFKVNAGKELKKTLVSTRKAMARTLENNEFLRYEVYSGSGENIRYQVAGGEVSNDRRIPASVKPPKSLNWDFEGEYWQDEIGSYRSTLTNNCPQKNAAYSGGQ